jgi:hypothetical protein
MVFWNGMIPRLESGIVGVWEVRSTHCIRHVIAAQKWNGCTLLYGLWTSGFASEAALWD